MMTASLWARAVRVPTVNLSRAAATRGVQRPTVSRRWLSAATATATQEVADGPSATAPDAPSEDTETPAFSTLKGHISNHTLKAIVDKPFKLTNMSPVQAAVLPLLPGLSEPYSADSEEPRDLLVRAKTGTGKTLAFLVPAIEARIRALNTHGEQAVTDAGAPADKYTQERAIRHLARTQAGCLVISPTRELATQIANEALRLSSHHSGFEVRLFVGGNSKQGQLRDWHKGRKDIVVGTPGRIRDILENEPAVREGLAEAKLLILDEADTLLEMGFRDDLDAIVSMLPQGPERQTFMFSATVSPQIRQIARTYLGKDHKYINCVDDSAPPTNLSIPQFHTVLPEEGDQLPHVLRLLAHDQLTHGTKSKTIIFTPTTKMTQLYSTLLRNLRSTLPTDRAMYVHEIHSKLSQAGRDRAARGFREAGHSPSVLVTSDISARGLDYPGVTRVIQIGVPSSADAYVHRAGRTGRGKDAGSGRVDLVLMPWEVGYVTWQLTEMPLKPQTTTELEKQVRELAERFDNDELAVNLGKARKPYTPVLEGMQEQIKALQGMLDEAAVTETMMSLLGYYGTRTGDLRVQGSVVVQGLKNWTTLTMGLPEPPYISANMLEKTGLGRKSKPDSPQRSRFQPRGQPHWEGRGRQSTRDELRGFDRTARRQEGRDEERGYERRSRAYSDKAGRAYGSESRRYGNDRESRGYDNDRESRGYDRPSRGYGRETRERESDPDRD
ncbi:DEAD-domain-containing protein [Daedalea quercina L-15889]|uniref:ATP-dependent RNA helicase n=1 Tax=Daedalea quercina L-15889 TaxID=1314783 RepID=A0A165R8V9_9APHY|nr:DEAD-domain-containing protein [Daedalea quercina L-15889]